MTIVDPATTALCATSPWFNSSNVQQAPASFIFGGVPFQRLHPSSLRGWTLNGASSGVPAGNRLAEKRPDHSFKARELKNGHALFSGSEVKVAHEVVLTVEAPPGYNMDGIVYVANGSPKLSSYWRIRDVQNLGPPASPQWSFTLEGVFQAAQGAATEFVLVAICGGAGIFDARHRTANTMQPRFHKIDHVDGVTLEFGELPPHAVALKDRSWRLWGSRAPFSAGDGDGDGVAFSGVELAAKRKLSFMRTALRARAKVTPTFTHQVDLVLALPFDHEFPTFLQLCLLRRCKDSQHGALEASFIRCWDSATLCNHWTVKLKVQYNPRGSIPASFTLELLAGYADQYTVAGFGTWVTGIVNTLKIFEADPTLLNSLDSRFNFTLVFTATSDVQVGAVQATLGSVLDSGVHAIVGDLTSSLTFPQALAIGGRFRTFMCSGSATSDLLSDKANYPTFFRSIPDDPQQGVVLGAFIRNMGWSYVAVFASQDSYGQSISAAFFANAASYNITIATKQFFDITTTQFGAQIAAVKQTAARVILLLGNPEGGTALLIQARKEGIVGPDYAWVGPESLVDLFLRELDAATTAKLTEATQGLMYIFPGLQRTTRTAEFEGRYTALYPGESIPPYAHFYYDCAVALARGLIRLADKVGYANASQHMYPNVTLADFFSSFPGTTGTVAIDSNGNRLGTFQVNNFRDGVATPVYQIFPDHSQLMLNEPRFFSGSSMIPADRPTPVPLILMWSDMGVMAFGIFMALLIIAFIAAGAYLFVNRHLALVRQLTFSFLMLINFGCVLMLASLFLFIDVPTSGMCVAEVWLMVTGGNIVLTCSVAKAYRIWSIFDNAAMGLTRRITNKDLFRGVVCALAVQTLILSVWFGVWPLQAERIDSITHYTYRCFSRGPPVWHYSMMGVLVFFMGSLLLLLVFLAYRTRKVHTAYGESIWLLYSAQNVLILASALIPFNLFDFGTQKMQAMWITLVLLVYGVVFTFYALVGRIALMIRLADNKSPSVAGRSTQFEPHTILTTASSQWSTLEQNKSSNRQRHHLVGTFPVKRGDTLLTTWKMHRVALCTVQGILTMHPNSRAAHDGDVILPLTPTLAATVVPGFDKCIRVNAIRAPRYWLIQFPTTAEYDRWAAMFTSLLPPTDLPVSELGSLTDRRASGAGRPVHGAAPRLSLSVRLPGPEISPTGLGFGSPPLSSPLSMRSLGASLQVRSVHDDVNEISGNGGARPDEDVPVSTRRSSRSHAGGN
ncbi:hypothetical protein H9P43_002238 [Blastocladiella emersonii ATCC 22665]|nr:hypothetical protein H9P43_002238 [Blastocladiella emersonii ATCC 22665]